MDTPVKRNISNAILVTVASSKLLAVGYSPHANVLTIQFPPRPGREDQPSIYQYAGVSQETFDAFNEAESKGEFFGESIAGYDRSAPLYPYVRLTQEEIDAHIALPTKPAETPENSADDPGMVQGGVNVAESLQEPVQARQAA